MDAAKALTLEAGKYYRTRDGGVAYVAWPTGGKILLQAVMDGYSFMGIVAGKSETRVWGKDGKAVFRCDDIVSELVEPKRIKGWINIYPEGEVSDLHASGEEADNAAIGGSMAGAKRIACIEVDVLEGDGLDGEVGR